MERRTTEAAEPGPLMYSRRKIHGQRRNFVNGIPFNGNFASLFTPGTVLQSVQTDLGLTYGGTPLATAGNTSTTVLTLSGTLATVPVPIWAKSTNSASIGAGATFNIYYDGLGVTPAMTGVAPTAGVGVALTGAGAGLTLTWAAGTSVNNDSWKATCSAWADQSSNLFHYTQAGVTAQPLVGLGLNGFPALLFDGVNDSLNNNAFTLPTPGTTPTSVLLVARVDSHVLNSAVVDDNNNGGNIAIFDIATYSIIRRPA